MGNPLSDLLDAVHPERNKKTTAWLSLEDGEAVNLVFLQELDPEADNYDSARGVGKIVDEVTHPGDFRRKAEDTNASEGKSYGWDMWRKFKDTDKDLAGKWRPKKRGYINVLAKTSSDEEPQVYIYSFGASPRSDVALELADIAQQTGSITDKVFTLKRRGLRFNTRYSLTEAKSDPDGLLALSGSELELHDLSDIPKKVPYADQPAFFAAQATEAPEESEPVAVDDEW